MKRAATEEGLWAKLASRLPSPPPRAKMVEEFSAVYILTPDRLSNLLDESEPEYAAK